MASFNRVILVGNLTRDPEVRYTPSGTAVSDIGLAVNRTWFDKNTNSKREEVTFVDVTLWGRQAEVAGEYLSKGRPVLIEGRLQMDQWEDRETGQKRSKLKVVGESMTMLGGRQDSGGYDSGQSQSSTAPAQADPSGGADGGGGGDASAGMEQPVYDAPPTGTPNDEIPF